MENFSDILSLNDVAVRTWGYAALFIAAWFEGMNTMIIGGFIASVGKLSLWTVLAVMTLGHAGAGVMWYVVGYVGGFQPLRRWGKILGITERRFVQAQRYFEQRGGMAILVAKMTIGLTIATMIVAGALKMPLRKFLRYNVGGSLLWTGATVFLGYSFGYSFLAVLTYIQSFTPAVLFFFVFMGAAFLLFYILRWILKTRTSKLLGFE